MENTKLDWESMAKKFLQLYIFENSHIECMLRWVPHKRKIRRMFRNGMSRDEIANELGFTFTEIFYATRDMPSHSNSSIRGTTLRILKIILNDGYYLPKLTMFKVSRASYFVLKKHFPTIKRIEARGHVILFFQERAEDACKAFLSKTRRNRIISYDELTRIMSLFGLSKPPKEKKEMIGKWGFINYPHPKRPMFKKQEINGKKPQNLDDFGRFLHSELLFFSSSECKIKF